VILEEPDIKIIGQMKKLNGIVAISVFNNDRNILLMGDVAIEPLLKIARTMLSTTAKITPLLDWGSFVHMTLQIPEGNIISGISAGSFVTSSRVKTASVLNNFFCFFGSVETGMNNIIAPGPH
jgi:hypothetical protein